MDLNRFFFRIWWGFHGKMWWFSWDLMRIKPVDRDSWWLMGYDFGELGVRWFNTASFRGAVLIVRFKAWHMENSGYVYYIYICLTHDGWCFYHIWYTGVLIYHVGMSWDNIVSNDEMWWVAGVISWTLISNDWQLSNHHDQLFINHKWWFCWWKMMNI
jgi:hypothetical protein